MNGDCSFLSGGEERGWKFSGDEAFLKDPNLYNDVVNAADASSKTSSSNLVAERNETEEKDKGPRL